MPHDDPRLPATRCPLVHVGEVAPCPAAELDPLLGWLVEPGAEAPASPRLFPRGAALPDGRLDLCKQSLGVDGAIRLLDALDQPAEAHPVRHLLLGTDGLGDQGARRLGRLLAERDPLQTVYLGCNNITAEGVAHLARGLQTSQRVRALWLKRNPLGEEGASALAEELLGSAAPIEILDLHNTELGPRGAQLILEALRDHPALRALYLGANGLGPDIAALVADVIATLPCLEALFLGLNPVGDRGACALAAALPSCPGLTTLSLGSCDVGSAGAEALLSAGAPLLHLDLGHAPSTGALSQRPNRVGDEGAEALACLLASDLPLRWLDLSGNGITSSGAHALLQPLERGENTHLGELRLGRNVSRKIKRRLRPCLERNAARHALPTKPDWVRQIESVYRVVSGEGGQTRPSPYTKFV